MSARWLPRRISTRSSCVVTGAVVVGGGVWFLGAGSVLGELVQASRTRTSPRTRTRTRALLRILHLDELPLLLGDALRTMLDALREVLHVELVALVDVGVEPETPRVERDVARPGRVVDPHDRAARHA